jgi:copper resistance protein D
VNIVAALIRFAHLAAAAFLLGSLAFHFSVARPALSAAGAAEFEAFSIRQLFLARWTLFAVFLTGLLGFWLQIATVAGVSLAQALRPENVGGVFLGTRYGIVWLARIGLMVVLAGVLCGAKTTQSNNRRALSLLLAAALTIALAFSGHGAAGEGSWLVAQLAAYALHLLAAGTWLGGLPALALFLGWISRHDHLSLQAALKETTRRFSLLGLACVTVLLLTGLFNAWTLVGAVAPLVGTTYGQLLLAKLALLLPLLGIAAINLFKLKPRILALGGERSMAPARELLRRLKRQVRIEAAIGACILLIVGFMSITPPARHIQPEWPFGFRWNLNVLDSGSAKVRAQFAEARWWAAGGLGGIIGYVILRRRRRYRYRSRESWLQ